jgi:hypothetical protein
MQQSAVFPPTIPPLRPTFNLHCLNYSTQHYLRYPHGMIYIARLCIAWLAAHLKLRFMTDRRLGIQHNHIRIIIVSKLYVYIICTPIMSRPIWVVETSFFSYSWYVAFQSTARKAWIRLFRFEFKVYRENICLSLHHIGKFPSKVASSGIGL